MTLIEMYEETSKNLSNQSQFSFTFRKLNFKALPLKNISYLMNYIVKNPLNEEIITDIYNMLIIFRCDDYKDRTDLTNKLFEIFKAKNHDYGGSVFETLKYFGEISSTIRIYDKLSRLYTLMNNTDKTKVKEESIIDTIEDAINYCIIAKMYIIYGEKVFEI